VKVLCFPYVSINLLTAQWNENLSSCSSYIYILKQIMKQWHVNTHEEMYEFAARELNALPCILYMLQVKVGAWELGRHMLVL
jgi:hypothetical protein